ncbi:RNA-binding protein [Candidatus Uhrbacteria bacterium]|nr:RNA-binding protein [Candidatus Uhrbacteria bacterium]
MMNKLFVGNLSWSATDDDLRQLFMPFGNVVSARVITDKMTGRSRGFGFVEMGSDAEAQAALDALNNKDFMGRPVGVSIARPKEE